MDLTDYKAVATKHYDKNERARLVVSLKSSHEGFYIDVRKWYRTKRMDAEVYGATPRGICLDLEDWRKVVILLEEMLNTADSQNLK